MPIEKIFSDLSTHMIQGMMTHEQLMNSYRFLGLQGYAACHEFHYLSETKGYVTLCRYKAEHFSSIVKSGRPSDPAIIPDSWYGKRREEVNPKTRREAMEAALSEWIRWEESTLSLYSSVYKDLLDLGLIDFAEFVKSYIVDVSDELVYARNEFLQKSAMDFDIVSVLEEQDKVERSFKKKIRRLYGNY